MNRRNRPNRQKGELRPKKNTILQNQERVKRIAEEKIKKDFKFSSIDAFIASKEKEKRKQDELKHQSLLSALGDKSTGKRSFIPSKEKLKEIEEGIEQNKSAKQIRFEKVEDERYREIMLKYNVVEDINDINDVEDPIEAELKRRLEEERKENERRLKTEYMRSVNYNNSSYGDASDLIQEMR